LEDVEESANPVEEETDSGIVENQENLESGEAGVEDLVTPAEDEEKAVENSDGLDTVIEEPQVAEESLEANVVEDDDNQLEGGEGDEKPSSEDETSEENGTNEENLLEDISKDIGKTYNVI
jgi:hypothetical protein